MGRVQILTDVIINDSSLYKELSLQQQRQVLRWLALHADIDEVNTLLVDRLTDKYTDSIVVMVDDDIFDIYCKGGSPRIGSAHFDMDLGSNDHPKVIKLSSSKEMDEHNTVEKFLNHITKLV